MPADVRVLSSSSPTCSQAASYRTSARSKRGFKTTSYSILHTEEDCRLDAEKAARHLSARGRQMYELRHAGFEWREIAQKLSTTDAAARAEFSRELKRARLKLTKMCPTKTDSRDKRDSTRQRECNS